MTPDDLLLETYLAGEQARREAGQVKVTPSASPCPACGTPMQRLEYSAAPRAEATARLVVEKCPSCRVEVRRSVPAQTALSRIAEASAQSTEEDEP